MLCLTATEKGLYDAIDGSASVGEMLARTLPSVQQNEQFDKVGSFFERLWWYGQVVFDTSFSSRS